METNFEETTRLAYNILIKYSDGTFPIDIFKIIRENFKNIKLIPFSKWKAKTKVNGTMFEELKTDYGMAFYDEKKYCIIYNDAKCLQTQRWTLVHELGHILRGHLSNNEYLMCSPDNTPFEMEANTFAKQLLVPFPVIRYLFSFLGRGEIYPYDIEGIFDVGIGASSYIINHLNKLRYLPTNINLENKFRNYFLKWR